ncbi:MAG: peptide chain release factor N(5)-glutamine methyltransferase [Proteobacteria bacterium]|nr:peptide chain release factor N(5)-glutamine methyltransferase [Pseudomonadota bacterium]
MIDAATSLRAALDEATRTLAAAGIDEARLEARHLIMAVLDLSLSQLVLREKEPLGAKASALNAVLARRSAREPLSRILGLREFRGLDFALGSETLDPRLDTEVLVEAALEALPSHQSPHLLDLGTGTGAILLAMLHALPHASGIGIDISDGAAAVAARNAERLNLGGRARFLVGDLFAPLAPETRFEAILSNPPYIPSRDLATLDPEVRLFDPARALDGGEDGLDFYRRIIAEAARFLTPGGLLAFEVGMGQDKDVADMLAVAGYVRPKTRNDLSGIARVVFAHAPE